MTDASVSVNKPRASGRKVFLTALGTILLILCLFPGVVGFQILYEETKGPFRHTSTAVDFDGDGDLDVLFHNIRFESEMTQWSGVTLWMNQGQGQFLRINPDIGSSAASAGDVDGDGDADIVALFADQATVFLNQGYGAFKRNIPILPPMKMPDGPGMQGTLALGDLNGDGWIDGFTAGCCGVANPPTSVHGEYAEPFSWVWINRWDPKTWLVQADELLTDLKGTPVGGAALGDLDGDGDLDVFAAVRAPKAGRESDPADRVLLNDGQGQLHDSGQQLGASDSTSAALGDLDGDGDLDALVGTSGGAEVWINQGGAQGGEAGRYLAAKDEMQGSQTGAVFLNDLDGDGDLDAVIGGARQAVIWWNDGEGNFQVHGQRIRYAERYGLALGDFTGDGRADLLAASEDYRLYVNQGDGTFR